MKTYTLICWQFFGADQVVATNLTSDLADLLMHMLNDGDPYIGYKTKPE